MLKRRILSSFAGQKSDFYGRMVRSSAPLWATVLAMGLCNLGFAQSDGGDSGLSNLQLSGAWVRAMPPTQRMTAAYLRIRNTGLQTITIDSVTSPLGRASLHETRIEAGRSSMQPVAALQVPPQSIIEFEPGGLHIMLMGVPRMPLVGESTQLCFSVDANSICVDARVQRDAPGAAEHDQHP